MLDSINLSDLKGPVLVAMSGGVDSSCTAALLKDAGVEVMGCTLKMQASPQVPSERAIQLASKTAEKLGIKHTVYDAQEIFFDRVISYFAHEYGVGRTPNPCIQCNPMVKFEVLLKVADELGAQTVVTGHYAKLIKDQSGRARLCRGTDSSKDQSYFLYRLSQEQRERIAFPLCDVSKEMIRAYADQIELPSAHEPDSQDVCFVFDDTRSQLVKKLHAEGLVKGDIVTSQGDKIGVHQGICNYTIGQRKGIGIGGCSEPLYVIGCRAETHEVIVGTKDELLISEAIVDDLVLHEEVSLDPHALYDIQIRSRSYPLQGRVRRSESNPNHMVVTFKEPVSALAPGQSCVWYRDDMVCGGGIVVRTSR